MIRVVRPDLVLVNPASRAGLPVAGRQLKRHRTAGLGGVDGNVRANQHFGVEIVDAEAERLTAAQAAERCLALKPALVAVVVYGHQPSASTQIMPAAGAVCSALKDLDPTQKVLLVGGHVAALPERTLGEEDADFVAGGEGLVTLVELLAAIKANESDLGKVSDLYYRDGAQVVAPVKRAPLVKNLDRQMPGIAWDLLPMDKYRAHNWHCLGVVNDAGELTRSPYAAIYTTLGCPYRCTFCCIQAPFKSGERELGMRAAANSYRFWSPRRVVDELEHLVQRYGVRHVKFADEMFVLNPRHVREICDGITARGLDLNIWAYARVDTVRDDMLQSLKAAGFRWLAFGIEAANARVRDDAQKGFDQQDIGSTLEKVAGAGIYAIGNYIFGLPEDDSLSMQETLDLAVDLNCEFANFYCAMAYPGSRLYDIALAGGWSLPEGWGGYSQHSVDTLPLETRYLSGSEVLSFRDRAFQTYYAGRRYLEMVQSKFGEDTVRHIREMASHTLVRKHAVPV